eukprot:137602-Alexandrium_andersonii.AAC.1
MMLAFSVKPPLSGEWHGTHLRYTLNTSAGHGMGLHCKSFRRIRNRNVGRRGIRSLNCATPWALKLGPM